MMSCGCLCFLCCVRVFLKKNVACVVAGMIAFACLRFKVCLVLRDCVLVCCVCCLLLL